MNGMDFLKNAAATYRLKVESSITQKIQIQKQSSSEINIDSIINSLTQGNIEALKELENAGIPYSCQKSANGFSIVKFSYNGENYTICCQTNDKCSEDFENKTEASPTKSSDFDFSKVPNIDKPVSELYEAGNYKKINSGDGYDKLFDSFNAMREQLHNYIKAKLEASGMKYDKELVDNRLDEIMTHVVQAAAAFNSNGSMVLKGFLGDPLPGMNLATVQDCINAAIKVIDKYLESCTGIFYTADFTTQDTLSEFKDPHLTKTADYLLTDEEKELKEILIYANPETGSSAKYKDKDEISHKLDIYSTHLKKYLKQEYPNNSDSEINTIIESSKKNILNNLEPDNEGYYNLGNIIILFSIAARTSITFNNGVERVKNLLQR